MKLNLKGQRENFVRLDFEEKRIVVASLLEGVQESNQLFADLYNLVMSEIAIEKDFYDIFDSLMIVLYREEKTEEQNALNRLGDIKRNLELQQARELADRKE